ncbi:MAG: hypothetical protein Q3X73_01895, partial [Phocaeicola sp.]|uniref:hypothetical protein n=1 Tax=Phocaeicola sp. TaxID=2773926 RepID=UPI002849120B
PKAGALTGLRYTPNLFFIFQSPYLSKAMQRYGFFLYMQIFKAIFFLLFFRIITYQIINQNINLKTFFIRNKEISV